MAARATGPTSAAERGLAPAPAACRPLIGHDIGAIDAALWDGIPSTAPAEQHGWLATCHRFERHPRTRSFVLVTTADGRVGAGSAAWVEAAPQEPGSPDFHIFGGRALPAALRWLGVGRCLVCVPPRDRLPSTSACGAVIDALLAHAREHNLPLVFRRVPENDAVRREALRARGFVETMDTPVSVLECRWSSFEGYLASLRERRRSRPTDIRRQIRRCTEGGIVVEPLADAGRWSAQLDALADAHYRRLNGMPSPFAPGFYAALARELGDRYVVVGARHGDRLLGFMSLLRHGREAYGLHVGVSAESREHHVYYNLLYRLIDLTITAGLDRLYGGTLLYDDKWRRGFDILPTSMFVRAPGRAAQFRLRGLLGLHRHWAQRKKLAWLARYRQQEEN